VLAVDRAQLAWIREGGTGACAMESWPYRDASAAQWQDAFGDAKPGFIDAIACNDLALHWVQAPPASVASFAELRQVVQARCAHHYGGAAGDWRVAADWHARRPFVCVALPQDVVLPIEQRLAEFKLVPRWHSAWSVLNCGAPQTFPSDGWSAVRSPARVVLWHCRDAQVDCMATWPVNAQEGTASAARRAVQQMQVEISRAAHSGGEVLHWMDLVADDAEPAGELPGVVPVRRDGRLAVMTPGLAGEAAAALALRALVGSTSA
jgi:hypothetical protein